MNGSAITILMIARKLLVTLLWFGWQTPPAPLPTGSLPQNLLLTRATRIASVEGWSGRNYIWLSNTQVLSLTDSTNYKNPLPWRMVDSATRRIKTWPSAPHSDSAFMFGVPSPNGKWLLYEGEHSTIIAMSLDGSKQIGSKRIKWPHVHPNDQFLWFPDSRHFIQLLQFPPTSAAVFSLDDPHWRRVVKIRGLASLGQATQYWSPESILGVTNNGHILITDDFTTYLRQGTADFYEVNLIGDRAIPRHFTIPLPQSGRIYEIALSPQGDRLAWGLQTIPSPHWPPVVGLWVSDIHGGHMRAIGTVKGERFTAQEPPGIVEGHEEVVEGWPDDPWPQGIRWLPDGKHLSFIYQNALWTVAVD